MNKISIYTFILWFVIAHTQTMAQTKPHQTKFYGWENGQWKLLESIFQSWYPNGRSKTTKTYDEVNQVYTFSDSSGYNSQGETMYYEEWKRNPTNTSWLNQKKFEYQYDNNNQIIAGRGFQWNINQWVQAEGFQRTIQWDIARQLETIVQTTFDPNSNSYKNAMKFENEYNSLGQVISSTVWMAHPTTMNFEYYSKDIYRGWHSVSDDIPVVYIRQHYFNNQWNTLHTSTTVSKSGQWETLSVEENGDRFKTIFDTKRENITRLQVVPGGTLLLYDKQTNGRIITQQWNNYNNQGQLEQVHVEEEEKDSKGQIIRTTDKYAYSGGNLAKENEVLKTYTYNAEGELVSIITSEFDAASGQTNYTGKIEYTDFRNINIPLAIKPTVPTSPVERKPTVLVYPNPFAEYITIEYSGPWNIITADGKLWQEGSQTTTISTNEWPTGIYGLQIVEAHEPVWIKIVKK